jgi:hypothetical protein
LVCEGWIFEDNLWPFLSVMSWLVKYDFDDLDWDAISYGTKDTDVEKDRWYDYEFTGDFVAKFRLAADPGTEVLALKVDIAERFAPQVETAMEIFRNFTVA